MTDHAKPTDQLYANGERILPKTGRSHPSPHDPKRLSILDAAKTLPNPPVRTNRSAKLPATHIGMLGNDRYGDCTCAAAAHIVQHLTYYEASKPDVDPDPADVVRTYLDLTGGQDTGLDLLTVLKRWQKVGIAGHQIAAYAETPWTDVHLSAAETRKLLKLTVSLSGSAYIAAWLPAGQQANPYDWKTVGKGTAWRPGGWGGHCVDVVDYCPGSDLGWDPIFGEAFEIETWGKRTWMSELYARTYCDEVFLPVSPDFTNEQGKTPQGRTLAKIVQLAGQIAAD